MAMCCLSTDEINEISSLSRSEGLIYLQNAMCWECFDPEDNLDKSIMLDFLYSTLEFCFRKGFPLLESCYFFQLSYEILNCCKMNTLTSTLLFFQSRCEEFKECVDENNLQCFSEFIFETFMKHYRLYQYVVECHRERDSSSLQMSVNVPANILPLKVGKEESVWNYEQKLRELELEERLAVEQKQAAFEEVKCKDSSKIECVYQALDTLPCDTKQKEIIEIIDKALAAHVEELSHSIKFNIETTVDEIKFKLKKNSIPRPEQLGPPPQYPTKAAAVKSKTEGGKASPKGGKASPKPGKKAESRKAKNKK